MGVEVWAEGNDERSSEREKRERGGDSHASKVKNLGAKLLYIMCFPPPTRPRSTPDFRRPASPENGIRVVLCLVNFAYLLFFENPSVDSRVPFWPGIPNFEGIFGSRCRY